MCVLEKLNCERKRKRKGESEGERVRCSEKQMFATHNKLSNAESEHLMVKHISREAEIDRGGRRAGGSRVVGRKSNCMPKPSPHRQADSQPAVQGN